MSSPPAGSPRKPGYLVRALAPAIALGEIVFLFGVVSEITAADSVARMGGRMLAEQSGWCVGIGTIVGYCATRRGATWTSPLRRYYAIQAVVVIVDLLAYAAVSDG